MVTPKYAVLALRLLRRRFLTPTGRRMKLAGMLFLGTGVTLQIGKSARVSFGRWVWVGHGTKIRCHEGEVRIGDKTCSARNARSLRISACRSASSASSPTA